MDKFDPKLCQPHLKMFLEDEYPPSALFLEYIPNMEMINIHNYTEVRIEQSSSGYPRDPQSGCRA